MHDVSLASSVDVALALFTFRMCSRINVHGGGAPAYVARVFRLDDFDAKYATEVFVYKRGYILGGEKVFEQN